MIKILSLILMVCSFIGAVVETEAAFDQRILIACATNPEAQSYLYLEKFVSSDESTKIYLKDVTVPQALEWAVKKARFGIAQAGVGILIKNKLIDDALIRKISLSILANMKPQDVFLGKAKPAFAWLEIEDKRDMTAEQFADIAPLLKNPLVAASVYQKMPDNVVINLVRGENFDKLDSSVQINLLSSAISRKLVDPSDPNVETKLENAAKGSVTGKITWFTYSTRRDAAIVSEYEAAIASVAKANDEISLMLLLAQAPALRTKVDIQKLQVSGSVKKQILHMNAGAVYKIDQHPQP